MNYKTLWQLFLGVECWRLFLLTSLSLSIQQIFALTRQFLRKEKRPSKLVMFYPFLHRLKNRVYHNFNHRVSPSFRPSVGAYGISHTSKFHQVKSFRYLIHAIPQIQCPCNVGNSLLQIFEFILLNTFKYICTYTY